jgi:hypothetical protein
LKRVSRPGLRRYVGADEIPAVLGGMGVAILSTPRGVLSGREAKKQKGWRRAAGLRLVTIRNQEVMSRIGNKAVEIPDKVKVNVGNDGVVAVEGPKGKLNWKLPRDISAKVDKNLINVVAIGRNAGVKALHGLSRSSCPQHGSGSQRGFHQESRDRRRRFQGGRARLELNLSLGFSHPILFPFPRTLRSP